MERTPRNNFKPGLRLSIVKPAPPPGSTPVGIPAPLGATTFAGGLRVLLSQDADLAQAVVRTGPPPLWQQRPCFATLVRIILEQQVSLAAAQAVFRRRNALAAMPTSLERRTTWPVLNL
jgi:hypothetical protein